MAEAAPEEKKEDASKAANFTGTWKLVTTDNLDGFLKAQGIGLVKRKLAAAGNMKLTIDHKDATLNVKAEVTTGSCDQVITLDEKEFDMDTPMGHKCKVIAKWKDDTKQCIVMTVNNLTTKKQTTMERTMPTADTMHDTVTNDANVKMVRKLKRI